MNCEACGHENVEGARFCASCGAELSLDGDSEDALVGQVIGGRFKITRVLGEGGMGVVYEAEQPMGSAVRKVAVKTLHPHLSHDPSVSQRFHRECGTVAQLEHPNTIKVYDFGATPEGTLYIAMEFVKGQPLNELIESAGPLDPSRVVKIMRQITGSLHEAHQKGIVHRDLKPENVILTERAGEKDVVKLLDFGIAARTESADAAKEQKLTQQGMVLGTPPYMSPEQFTGKALDARSDIYSLGVMAYEMLTGRLPFEANTPWQWATEHMTSQPIPFEATNVSTTIPEQMRQAIMRALAKDRDQRQETAKLFCQELAGEAEVPQGPHAAAGGSTGTAAMEAAPDFSGASSPQVGTARTEAMPAASGSGGTSAGMAAPVTAVAPSKQGGGKGLLIGLASLGGVLLIGIVVVAARSMKPDEEVVAAPPEQTKADEGPSRVENHPEKLDEPSNEESTGSEGTNEPAPPQPPRSKSPSPPPAKTSEPAPSPPPAKTSEPAPSPPPVKTSQPAPPAQKSGKAACNACLSAAQSGNLTAAASSYRSCDDASAKRRCQALARSKAVNAARSAAFNGNCSQAKAIVAAAGAMGASTPALKAAVSSCK